jgi:hypothetical protein
MNTRTLQRLGAALAAAALLGIGTAVAQQPSPPTEDQLRTAFNAADANRDGYINVDEAVADAILVFARFDTNRDGFLVMTELARHDPERIKRADRDGDGRLSIGEVASDRVYDFFLVDANRDGSITLQELILYVKQRNPGK